MLFSLEEKDLAPNTGRNENQGNRGFGIRQEEGGGEEWGGGGGVDGEGGETTKLEKFGWLFASSGWHKRQGPGGGKSPGFLKYYEGLPCLNRDSS